MTESTPSRSANQYERWEQEHFDLLERYPGSARSREPRLKKFLRRIRRRVLHPEDAFLRRISGVIHVGAHVGQECDIYYEHGLNVLWIEPIPRIFQTLSKAIRNYPRQSAASCLVADVDGKDCALHVSSNHGASSSILDLAAHKDIWPEISFTEQVPLKSITLSTLVKRENVDMARYDALVMDTQGAEMLVLKGASDILARFRFIKTEAADFEVYKGCCTVADLDAFLTARGFRRVRKKAFTRKPGVGACYDLVYSRGTY
jgi:FkbM family methyltransferase